MNKTQIQEIAEQASKEENVSWSVAGITTNPQNPAEWEIYFDARGRKYHKILFRNATQSGSTADSIKSELRGFIRELKQDSRF